MKKQGFTLIELLAVIVILAIIALIAVPIVFNIISDTKEKADEASIEMYKKSVNNAIAEYIMNNNGKNPTSISDVKPYISYSGNEVICMYEAIEDGEAQIEDCFIKRYPKTPDSCFIYQDNYDYTINKDVCMSVIGEEINGTYEATLEAINYNSIHPAETVCSGDKTQFGDLINFAYALGHENPKDYLVDNGVITITPGSENGNGTVSIVGYKCGADATGNTGNDGFYYTYTKKGEYMDVVIPQTLDGKKVTKIGVDAFFPESLSGDFKKNILVDSVELSDTIEVVEAYSFFCSSISRIIFSDNVKYISNFVSQDSNINSVKFGRDLTFIGGKSFENNKLKKVVIPDNVEFIGYASFYKNKIEKVKFGKNLKIIGNSSFYTNKLKEVVIPKSVTNIGDFAFVGNQLTSVIIKNDKSNVRVGDAFNCYDTGFNNSKITWQP